MLDLFDIPSGTNCDVQVFAASASVAGVGWQQWLKPRGATMAFIFALGGGGAGGEGARGAASAAAGGSGGSAAAQTSLLIPLIGLPDVLFVSPGRGGNAGGNNGTDTRVSIYPDTVAIHCLVFAPAGGGGNGGAGATPGALSPATSAATLTNMPRAGMGKFTLLGGMGSLIATASNTTPVALTLPVTGSVTTAGGSGAGLGAAGTAGAAGSGITGAGVLPTLAGGAGAASATVKGGDGSNGFNNAIQKLLFIYGGAGGGSGHGSATGAGLVQSSGGKGGYGSGGGGGGGALTAATFADGGLGGDGIVIIISW